MTLSVGKEFEGERKPFTHEVDTLSTLLAEQEAIRASYHLSTTYIDTAPDVEITRLSQSDGEKRVAIHF